LNSKSVSPAFILWDYFFR